MLYFVLRFFKSRWRANPSHRDFRPTENHRKPKDWHTPSQVRPNGPSCFSQVDAPVRLQGLVATLAGKLLAHSENPEIE